MSEAQAAPARPAAWRRATDALLKPFRPKRGAMDRVARVPNILQLEAAECGAASLTMILAYHGCWMPLDKVRFACGVSRDGSKASNIIKAARSYGLEAKGFRKEPSQLGDIVVPAIVHWNFNHFLVLEGIRGGKVYLSDPAAGRRVVSSAEFDESFTGVVLAFEPGPNFVRGGIRPRPMGQLLDQMRTSRMAALLVGLFSLLLVVPGLIVPGLSKLFIDKVMLQHFQNWVLPVCGALLAATLLQAGITYLQQRYLVRIEAKLAVVMSSRVLTGMLAQPISFFGQRFAGELAGRIGSADNIAQLLSGQVASTAFNMIAVVMYGGAMLLFDPLVAAVALCVPIINISIMRVLRKRMTDLNKRVAVDHGKLMGRTVAVLTGIETIKVSGSEGDAFGQWAGQHGRTLTSIQSLAVQNGIVGAVPGLLQAFGTTAVLSIGGLRVIEGAMTLGSLMAMQTLLGSFMGPLSGLMGLFSQIQNAQGDLNRISELVAPPAEEAAPAKPEPAVTAPAEPITLAGRVELRNVSFGYSPTDPPLIRDFSLTLEPGMRVALVGGSGSGKSTVGRMIAGLTQPWGGEILFDDRPLSSISPRDFSSSVSYVDQEVFLFEGTVRDNLTLWDPTIPEGLLVDALKDAEIYPEIAGRDGAIDSEVKEGGTNFSGGQRQRLEIARAFVPNPSVLILDEATAALDVLTEQRIDQAIRRRGCTCIIIAHRLSAIRDADEIIVLRRGKIVERGNHESLVAAGKIYAGLVAAEV